MSVTNTTNIRCLDKLSRIVIPDDMRRALGLGEGSTVSLTLTEDSIIIRRTALTCMICGETIEHGVKDRCLCPACFSCVRDRIK